MRRLLLLTAVMAATIDGGQRARAQGEYHLPPAITLQESVKNFGLLKQGSAAYCAPYATMNSFIYLTNTFPGVYSPKGTPLLMGGKTGWTDAANLLASAAYMNVTADSGTTPEDWVNGKYNYMQKFAPGTTTFAGMDSDEMENRPSWVEKASPTIDFLIKELQGNEDVELWLDNPNGGLDHVVTLTGLKWDGTTLTLNTIDPANPSIFVGEAVNTQLTVMPTATGMGALGEIMSTNYPEIANYKGWTITGAVAESSVPEPSSLILAVLGAVGFVVRAGLRWTRNQA